MGKFVEALVPGLKIIMHVPLRWLAITATLLITALTAATRFEGSFLLWLVFLSAATFLFFKKSFLAPFTKGRAVWNILGAVSAVTMVASFTFAGWGFFVGLQNIQTKKVEGENSLVASLIGAPSNFSPNSPNNPSVNQNLQTQTSSLLSKTPPAIQIAPAEDAQDQSDDVLEKIDLLKAQLILLTAPPILDAVDENVPLNNENNIPLPTVQATTALPSGATKVTSYTGGGSVTAYPRLLISEIQIGGATNAQQEFVELYNPNNQDVDLTSWYLQRKTQNATSFATYAPSTLFAGKRISAKGYFLIARQGSGFLANVFVDNPLTSDNTLALKNPNGDIVDKVGFGQAGDYEAAPAPNPPAGESIGRDSNESNTDNNLADFAIDSPTPNAQNVLYVAPPLPPPPTDNLPPSVAFTNLVAKQNSLSFTINFTITDIANVVSPSGVAGYVFRWKTDTTDWQQDPSQNVAGAPAVFSGTRNFTGSDETNYYFQIETTDAAGNQSDWQPETPATTRISLFKKVLINEIQTAGVTTKDEFIELYNPNMVDMNLQNFSLKKETASGASSNLVSAESFSGTIKAAGFFLITPQKNADGTENYTGLAPPDLRYSGATFSIASNNTVLLYNNAGTLLDKVGFGSAEDFEGAAAPNPPTSKSIERVKLGQDTDNNLTDFKISDAPTPGGTFPKTTMQDATDYPNSMASSSPGAPTFNLLITWSSPSQNISFYQVQYQLNNGDWTDWLANTQTTQSYFSVPYSLINDHIYSFRARATDNNGSIGSWSNQITIDFTNPVVINEVGYAGTDASPSDQWIELYNKSDNDINLTGWNLVSGNTGHINTLSLKLNGTILAKGYFILERNDDNTLSDVPANQIFQSPLGNSYLYLSNASSRYVDEFYIPNVSSLTNNGVVYSMERVSPYSFGNLAQNWKVNNGSLINAHDRNGNPIYGTPGRQNSVYQMYTYVSTSFIENTTLTKDLSPYVFSGPNVQVFKGVTLTVNPGVVIKFYDDNSNLTVKGTLQAVGSDSDHIVFTSYLDDQFGGDSNGDGNKSSPSPGDWLGLYFSPDSQNSDLENVDVRYGGAQVNSLPPSWGDGIWVDHSAITLKNSTVENNENVGLRLVDSSSVIDSTTFLSQNTAGNGQNSAQAIDVEGGAPIISNSDFENNTYGIYMGSFADPVSGATIPASPQIYNNTFSGGQDPMYVDSGAYPVFSGDQAQNNVHNATIFSGDVSQNTTLSVDLPYLIKSIIEVPQNTTLTLDPGVVVKFADNNSGLKVDGTLNAVGTSANPITFTADTSTPSPGDWLGLSFTNTSQNSDLENVNISYAGAFYASPQNQDFSSAIKADNSMITLKNSVIENNANNGLWLVNSPSTIDNVQFLNQNTATLSLPAKAAYVQGGAPTISNSDFENNTYGIYSVDWTNPVTNQDIPATPDYSQNNTFSGSQTADIYP